MIMLDSNICIALLRQEPKALRAFKKTGYGRIAVPNIVRAELYYGAYISNRTKENLEKIEVLLSEFKMIEMNKQATQVYAQIRLDLRQRGQMIGPNDLIIAAIALADNYTLVTNNTKEFARISGLKLDDWLS